MLLKEQKSDYNKNDIKPNVFMITGGNYAFDIGERTPIRHEQLRQINSKSEGYVI